MCGIAGIISLNGNLIVQRDVIKAMANQLSHRGPDDTGLFMDGPVGFGFSRLSIIDLETGHQPLANAGETVWVMFNGEIYNFIECRQQLEQLGYSFQTQSDTEVIVYAYEAYGLDFVHHLRGMFAIALWDRRIQRLVLARDRLGKKPLFYSYNNGELAFASELKGLLPWPHLERQINAQALHDYLTFLYLPAPDSVFTQVKKLLPGHLLVVDVNNSNLTLHPYWQLNPLTDDAPSFTDYTEQLRDELSEAVRLRLRSDVPLGAFLSGGIDSTIIVGLMSQFIKPVQTFSIGFPDKRFDESEYAQIAAAHFATVHHTEQIDASYISAQDFSRLIWYMDEPFADSSFLPTYWVAKMARQKVTVALSGDGGDELFAGYNRYRYWQLIERLAHFPQFFRYLGQAIVAGLYRGASPFLPGISEWFRQIHKAFQLSDLDKAERLLLMLSYFDQQSKKDLYTNEWQQMVGLYTSKARLERQLASLTGTQKETQNSLSLVMARDITSNMVDDALVKVDRASMACSLEMRSPLLDQQVVELALRIPTHYKLQGNKQKIIFKRAFQNLLPQAILQRGKKGFEVPFAQWFQQPDWKSLLLDVLSETRLKTQGIFAPKPVLALRDAMLHDPEARYLPMSAYQLKHRVWLLFVFQMWYEQFMI